MLICRMKAVVRRGPRLNSRGKNENISLLLFNIVEALTILCWIHSWCEYINSPPKSTVTCDRSTCANKSSSDEHTISRNLNSSLKNFELTSDMAFWKKPDGRITYTTWMIPGKYDCKLSIRYSFKNDGRPVRWAQLFTYWDFQEHSFDRCPPIFATIDNQIES